MIMIYAYMLSLVNLESCVFKGTEYNLLKLRKTYSSISISINHFHVWFNIISCWLVILSHLFVSLLYDKWNLILSQKAWLVFIKHFEEPSCDIKSFLGNNSQIFYIFLGSWITKCQKKYLYLVTLDPCKKLVWEPINLLLVCAIWTAGCGCGIWYEFPPEQRNLTAND